MIFDIIADIVSWLRYRFGCPPPGDVPIYRGGVDGDDSGELAERWYQERRRRRRK